MVPFRIVQQGHFEPAILEEGETALISHGEIPDLTQGFRPDPGIGIARPVEGAVLQQDRSTLSLEDRSAF